MFYLRAPSRGLLRQWACCTPPKSQERGRCPPDLMDTKDSPQM